MNEDSTKERLDWEQISAVTPMLFLHDHQASPPPTAKRLWDAVSHAELDVFDCAVAKSLVKARLMTLALIQQEFRVLVWRQGSMIQPVDILGFLEVPIEEIIALTGQQDLEPLQAALMVDAANRRQLSPALAAHFGDTDTVFKILAFPEGVPDVLADRDLDQLLDPAPVEQADDSPANDIMAQLSEPPNADAGVAFIESGFARNMKYAS